MPNKACQEQGAQLVKTFQLVWEGPYSLVGSEGSVFDCPAAHRPGIYLFSVEYQNGYMIYNPGITTRPLKDRIREHIAAYRDGEYNILDTNYFPMGKREQTWHGIAWTPEKDRANQRAIFEIERQKRSGDIEALLLAFRIFLAPLDEEKRILERIETAIIKSLYSSEEPFRSFPDKNMHQVRRGPDEPPFMALSITGAAHFHALQDSFEA